MNVTPSQLFPGFSATATSITIPLSALPILSGTESDATTGNGMEVLRAIVDKASEALKVLTPETSPTRANAVKVAPSIAYDVPGALRQSYTLSFDIFPTGFEPAPEQ